MSLPPTSSPAPSTIAFGPLSITYDERVLEPRPWTAQQSRWAVEVLASPEAPAGPVLELCTGAGHIGLLVVAESERSLVAVDVDPVACAFARANAERAGLGHRVEVRETPLAVATGSDERFAMVVADPPWVASSDVGVFPDDPLLAIDGGADGLDLAWECVTVAADHLVPGGSLLLQLGTSAQCDVVVAGSPQRLAEAGRRGGERGWLLRLDAVG